tara:strand:- start:2517 stop:2810 length:294 start_codon:yes stop_codon:yes gene_type:complete
MNKRTRTDKIISITITKRMKDLLDFLSSSRGIGRSEYLRYLILQDAENYSDIVDTIIAEGSLVKRGRLGKEEQFDDFLEKEEQKNEELKEKYKEVLL